MAAPDIAALTRHAVKVLPEGELERKLEQGRPLRVKLGIDPTARDIHVGNAIPLGRMRAFQEQGHTGVLIIGDYTARIGDPSGRSAERKVLSDEEIDANARAFFEQASQILDPARTELRFNSEWLAGLDFADVLRLTRVITVSRLLERNDFAQRFAANRPISVSEFLYPLMQGYDSVAIKADVELGGTDQEYNLLAARDIQQAYGVEPQVVLTTPLINGPNGTQKMSASLDNYIGIAEPPAEMYGKAMSAVDDLMPLYYELVLDDDAPPPDDPYVAKREFARRLVERWHGAEAARDAEAGFDRMFKEKRATEDAPVIELPRGDPVHVPALLADNGLAASRGDARRLIAQGGVHVDGATLAADELDVPVDRHPELPEGLSVRIRELPRELLPRHLDDERVRPGVAVLREHDRADDRDRGHEHERDRGPDDLERRVPVDGRAVGEVALLDPELEQRVDEDGRDEREDAEADPRREPVREPDPPRLAARRRGHPGNEHRHGRSHAERGQREAQQLEERAPAHRAQPYWIVTSDRPRTEFEGKSVVSKITFAGIPPRTTRRPIGWASE